MAHQKTDHYLLFGIIAWQLRMIDREQLIAGLKEWSENKSHSFSKILLSQGALTRETRLLIKALVTSHMEKHDNDPKKYFRAVGPLSGELKIQISAIGDDALNEAIKLIPSQDESSEGDEESSFVAEMKADPRVQSAVPESTKTQVGEDDSDDLKHESGRDAPADDPRSPSAVSAYEPPSSAADGESDGSGEASESLEQGTSSLEDEDSMSGHSKAQPVEKPAANDAFCSFEKRYRRDMTTVIVISAALILICLGFLLSARQSLREAEESARLREPTMPSNPGEVATDDGNTSLTEDATDESRAIAVLDEIASMMEAGLLMQDPRLDDVRRRLFAAPVRFHQARLVAEAQSAIDPMEAAASHIELVRWQRLAGDYEAAMASIENAFDSMKPLRRDRELSDEVNRMSADLRRTESILLQQSGDLAAAIESSTREIEIRRRQVAPEVVTPERRHELAHALRRMATLKLEAGEVDEAVDSVRRANAIWRDLQESGENVSIDLAAGMHILAECRFVEGKITPARNALTESLQLTQAIAPPGDPELDLEIVRRATLLGKISLDRREDEAALRDLALARERVDSLSDRFPGAYSVLVVKADLYETLADACLRNDQADDGRQLLEESISIAQSLADSLPQSRATAHELSTGYGRLGEMQLGQGEVDAGRLSLEKAVSIAERLMSTDESDAAARTLLAEQLVKLALCYDDQSEDNLSLVAYVRLTDLREPVEQSDEADFDTRVDQGRALKRLGELYIRDGKPDKALAALERSIHLTRQLINEKPDAEHLAYRLAIRLRLIARVYADLEQPDQSVKALQEAVVWNEKLVDQLPDSLRYLVATSRAYMAVAEVIDSEQDAEQLRSLLERTHAMNQRIAAHDEATMDTRVGLARTEQQAAELWAAIGEDEAAEKAWVSSVDLLDQLVQHAPKSTGYRVSLARAHQDLGDLYQRQNRWDYASIHYDESQKQWTALRAADPQSSTFKIASAVVSTAQGDVAVRRRAPERALTHFELACAELEQILARNPDQAPARSALRNALESSGATLQALENYQEAADDWARAADLSTSARQVRNRSRQAVCLARTDRYALAIRMAESLESEAGHNPLQLARVFALCVGKILDDQSLDSEMRNGIADHCVSRSIELLQNLVKEGELSSPEDRDRLRNDPDFSALRDVPAFQQLLQQTPAI